MSKHQTPEEKFDAAMRDPRLIDEAAGFISDQDALATIGLAYWTAITRAQLRIARGEF